jgi:hypothetical protein
MRIFVLIAVLTMASCQAQPQAAPNKAALGWLPIETWSGTGNSQTDSFYIGSGQWRIKWATSNEQIPGKGKFRVTVHSLVSGRFVVVAVDRQGVGSDIAYVAEDPRQFFLLIESSGVDWKVSVEEGVVGEQESPKRKD